ncbi:MAG TPA: nicotinate (nicotinamide) nucleotide adenylyltransferase [Edaphobacter sp.]|nr:nicotinate (nicotinamide) nucleotide adenylyltransferase [Edaphobacter sp.]
MRVALFGGTFDPPHRGHIRIAQAAADAYRLDSVLFAPVALQPLKAGLETAPFSERLAMVQLACAADSRFSASTIDAPRADGEPNYTIDTLTDLRRQHPTAILFNLIGADSFLHLRQWRESNRLLTTVDWIVVSRPGSPLDDLTPLQLTETERSHIHLLTNVSEDVSATELRRKLAAGEDCANLLPSSVAAYIRQHGLYSTRYQISPASLDSSSGSG